LVFATVIIAILTPALVFNSIVSFSKGKIELSDSIIKASPIKSGS
jgi:hypothetical protein